MRAFLRLKFKEINMTIIIVIVLFLILCGVAPDLAAGRSSIRDWASRVGTLYTERRVKDSGGESGKG
jgi:hypothetical protein